MTPEQYAQLMVAAANGRGIEASIAAMGLDNAKTLAWLQAHPTAKGDIELAKLVIASNGR